MNQITLAIQTTMCDYNIEATNLINARIWKLWKDNWDGQNSERMNLKNVPKFVLVPQKKADLVVLGLNPACPKHLQDKTYENYIREQLSGDRDVADYQVLFKWEGSGLENATCFQGLEELAIKYAKIHYKAREHYPWFERINQIANELGSSQYTHIDLYLWLDTKCPKSSKVNDFANKQLDIAWDLVLASEPKIIMCPYKCVAVEFLKLCSRKRNIKAPRLRKTNGFDPRIEYADVEIHSGQSVKLWALSNLPKKHADGFFDEEIRCLIDVMKNR